MGACSSSYTITCDIDGIIINVTKPLLHRLGYKKETLENKFIGILMSDFMSMLHKKFFIKMFKESKEIERNRLENKLKALHHKRSLIIYDIDKKAHNVNVSIEVYKPDLLTVEFEFLNDNIDLFYTGSPKEVSTSFKVNKSNTVLICTDFMKSTELLHDKGVVCLIDTSIQFHKEIVNLIRSKYYPFVYLHEVVGDSFVLALNTDWVYNIDTFCATLAVNFMFDLIQHTREFVKIRTGIGYGKIHYGTIGNSFSFFGFPMNIAARLENKCDENEINICENFYNKLIKELTILSVDHKLTKKTAFLKGFGETEYYSIPVSENSPFIEYFPFAPSQKFSV